MTTAALPDKVEVVVSCACDCACHQRPIQSGSTPIRCHQTIQDGAQDCANDCRGTTSGVVCDPFIWRTE